MTTLRDVEARRSHGGVGARCSRSTGRSSCGATTSGHLLDASLGYFINPLVSIALGMLVLRERLRRLQWLAIACATIGVALLTWRAGRVPWIALVLAVTFGLYGLIRKTAKVDALVGSTIETLLLAPVAAIYLAVLGGGVMVDADAATVLAARRHRRS